MTKIALISLILFPLIGCTQVPEIARSIENIATDDAIVVKVDRDAIGKNNDVSISVDVVCKQ